MQPSTGLIEATVVEVKDRDKIGGAYLHSDVVCCTPALSKDGYCKVGEVIIREDLGNINDFSVRVGCIATMPFISPVFLVNRIHKNLVHLKMKEDHAEG